MTLGFDDTLFQWLNVAGAFAFGLSGGLAGVRARLNLIGVLVLAAVVGLTGGIIRDVLIGQPPTTFRDGHYLAAVGLAGLVCYFAHPAVEKVEREMELIDAIGLGLFCVTGASLALDQGLGPVQAVILGAITGIGGGMLRDVLLLEIPHVLRQDLYAIPALLGASVVVIAFEVGSSSVWFTLLGIGLCFAVRLIGILYGINVPAAPLRRGRGDPPGGPSAS